MTLFNIVENGRERYVDCDITEDNMRIYLSLFKTHCTLDKSAYEYTHFKNWLQKNYHVGIKCAGTYIRVDM